jgi:type II secretory pathway component PulF
MASGILTLDDFSALNDQLAALVEAGVPIDVKLGDAGASPARILEKFQAVVHRRVRHGETLPQALEGNEHDWPESYQSFMQLAVRAGDSTAALVGSNRLAESAVESRYAAASAFLYPLVVCALAIVGLVAFCLFLVPTVENVYRSLELAPGPGLRLLDSLRTTWTLWAGLAAIVVLLVLAWSFRSRLRRARPTPAAPYKLLLPFGLNEAYLQLRCAVFAEALAETVENGMSLDEALPLAASASGDRALRNSAGELATSIANGQFPPDDCPLARRFPPFLRWAVWQSEATVGRERALRMAGSIYREAAERRIERAHSVVPLVVLVVIGGGATLLYALALFVPVVELLRTLAS